MHSLEIFISFDITFDMTKLFFKFIFFVEIKLNGGVQIRVEE